MKTTILLDHEVPGEGRHIVRALLRIEGDAPPADGRLPLGLSLVLDRSGSMLGEKLDAARRAAAQLVRRLRPEDIVSVVAYDDHVITVAEPAAGEAQADLPRHIERIGPGGMTNLSGGWLRARELLQQTRHEQGTRRIMLLTDGLANVGITDRPTLVGLCAQARESGVTTTTIGFGADYDEHLLRAMAEAGGGNLYYIERPDQAAAIFADEAIDLLSLSAQNLAVTIEPAVTATLVAVHHAYPRRTTGNRLRLEIGDLYAREPRSVLIEFAVHAESVAADDVRLADVVISAQVVTAAGIEQREIRLPITISLGAGPRADAEVRKEMLYLDAASAREAALEHQERGDFQAAGQVLRSAVHDLAAAPYADADLQEEAEDLAALSLRFEDGTANEVDAKYMYQRAHDARRARASKKDLISRVRRQDPPAG